MRSKTMNILGTLALFTSLTSFESSQILAAAPATAGMVTPPTVDFQKGFSEIAENAIPSVVNVSTTQIMDKGPMMQFPGMGGGGNPLEDFFKEFMDQQDRPRRVQSLGSGFIIKVTDKEAFIITNYHVVADAKKVSIILHDKTEVDVVLHSFDDRTDLGVLKVKLSDLPEGKRNLRALEWGDSNTAKVGHFVLAIGNPFGLGSTVTSGIISGKGRDIVLRNKNRATDFVDDFIQHQAPINMGNSGGALLNTEGKVVGINTAIFSPSGGNIGIGFAIPSALAKSTVDQLLQYGRTKRGWLGVSIQPLSPEVAEALGRKEIRGGVVAAVAPNSPAEKAGIRERDIIIGIDGKLLDDHNRITRVVGETEVGKTIDVKVLRDNDRGEKSEVDLKVVVGEFPSNLAAAASVTEDKQDMAQGKTAEFLGMRVAELPKNMANADKAKPLSGVVVIDVKDASSADDSQLRKGDILTEVNVTKITSPEQAAKIVEDAKKAGRGSVVFTVIRQGFPPQFVSVEFKSLSESSITESKEGEVAKVEKPKEDAKPEDANLKNEKRNLLDKAIDKLQDLQKGMKKEDKKDAAGAPAA